jgi:porin
MRTATATLSLVATLAATSAALAGAKDESAADWLFPKAFNDWRNSLADRGLALGGTYVADNIANVTGGMSRGAIHFGRLDLSTDADLEKLFGWSGAKFHGNTFWIYGRGLSRNYIGNLATISEIEARPDIRLYEAYIEQSFWGGALTVKAGQQAADIEFFDSQTDDLFVNGTFGWPAIKATNLPAGGPAPPIAVPGVRVKAKLGEQVTAYAAIFNGNPARPGDDGDPQLRDNHGLAFRVSDPPWLIGQVHFDYNLPLGGNGGLPGNITPGGWYHLGDFDDQRFTSAGLSLADPDGTGIARKLRRNYGIFAVLEQALYRPPAGTNTVAEGGAAERKRGVTAFARVAYSPPDRNLIDLYVDGGIGFDGMIESRPLDRFGVAVAYMHISRNARQLDFDTQFFSGLPTPVRTFEGLVEFIYEAHLKPGWLLQPFFQYVFRPSGGVSNPTDPIGISRIGDAAIFGLTTTLKY